MPKRKGNRDKQSALVSKPVDQITLLHVHYVRMHDESDELTLAMKFSDGSSIPVDRPCRICQTTSFGPFIYIFDLDVRMGNEKLYIELENGWKELSEYRLEMSYFRALSGQHKLEETGSEGHSLKDYFHMQHCFLFGIRFGSRFSFFIPGKSLRKISDKNE